MREPPKECSYAVIALAGALASACSGGGRALPALAIAPRLAVPAIAAEERAPPPDPIERARPPASIGPPFHYPSRPTVYASFAFDYSSLPLLGPSEASKSARFQLVSRQDGGSALHVDEDLLAEVELGTRRRYTTSFRSPLDARRMAAGKSWQLRQSIILADDPCDHGVPLATTWRGLKVRTWTPQSVTFLSYEGAFDPVRCEGTARSVASVVAQALVPNVVYAFRRCMSGCDAPGDSARTEELTLLGPPAAWVASSASIDELKHPHVGSFSMLQVPIRRGGSASSYFHVGAAELGYFLGVRAARSVPKSKEKDQRAIAISIELSWPASASEPDAIGYLAEVTPGSRALVSPPGPIADGPGR